MKKKLFTLLIAIVASIAPTFASVQIGDLYYKFNSNTLTAEVTYKSYSGDVYNANWDITIATIPDSVFYNGVTYSVTSIGYDAFAECSRLSSVTIPNSVTSIGDGAFIRCYSLTSVTIPNSVTSIGYSAFEDCTGLTSVHIRDLAAWCGITFSSNRSNPLCYAKHLFLNYTEITDLVIPESVTSIGNYAFYNCTGLTSVTIPNSVTNIGYSAFSGCYALTSVTIPESVISIGNNAFYDVAHIAYSGSAIGSPWGARHVNGYVDGYLIYSDETKNSLLLCSPSATGEIVIPNSVTCIGDSAFYRCSSLSSVTIPESVTSIGNYAFSDCSGLTSVTIPESVTSIGNYAFSSCSGLTSVTIPESVTSIGNGAFDRCYALTSVTIPESVTSIGNCAFSECGLTSLTIPKSVTSIGNNAFSDCYNLTSVIWNAKNCAVSNYDHSPFYTIYPYSNRSQITSFVFGDEVESIPAYLCYEMNNLTSVTIPESVTSIGDNAFYGCSGLTSVIWNARNCASHSYIAYSRNAPFYSARAQITSFVIGDEVESIPAHLCFGMSNLTSFTIPESVTSIEDYAFQHCSGLKNVTIGNSVTTIKNGAFQYCSGLRRVTLPESITSIGENTFADCSNLEAIIVPCQDIDRFMEMLGNDSRVKCGNPIEYSHLITLLADSMKGKIEIVLEPYDYDSLITVCAIPNEGYSFLKWNDGNTNAQRKIKLTDENQIFAAIFSQNSTSLSYLATGGYGLGEMSTDNTNVWSYNSSYGAYGSRSGGVTGNLFTPAKDMRKATNVTLSFQHAHKFAGTPSEEFTLWVTKDFKGSWDESEWHQLTISPYTSNTNWTFSSVTINVPVKYVGKGTVFAFRYQSTSSNYGTWEIKNLNINITWSEKYLITDETDPAQGFIVGAGLHDYLATAELTATPQYGYHFTQWSDGDTVNPRTIVIASDTTFVAEFAADKSGTCGDDNLLTWEYDDQAMILTISGEGTLNSNYTYGVEAPEQAERLIINNGVTSIGDDAFRSFSSLTSLTLPNCVTSIGNRAFSGCSGLTNVTIPNSVTSIGEEAFNNCQNIDTLSLGENIASYGDKAFAGCPNITAIYNYRPRPARLGTETFKDVDYFNSTLYVLAGSVNMYKSSGSDWKDFYFIEPIGAEEVTTDNVTVVPHDNTADITWPKVAQAETYEIQITKDGEVFCVLVFNAQGQLVSIAFAPSRHNVAEQAQADGFSFTVTGLDSSTGYDLTITAKDDQGEVLITATQSFTTTGDVETALGSVESSAMPGVSKILHNGQLFITLPNGSKYSATGVKVE